MLDLDVNVADGIYEYKLCDKIDNCPIFIVPIPDPSDGIPE